MSRSRYPCQPFGKYLSTRPKKKKSHSHWVALLSCLRSPLSTPQLRTPVFQKHCGWWVKSHDISTYDLSLCHGLILIEQILTAFPVLLPLTALLSIILGLAILCVFTNRMWAQMICLSQAEASWVMKCFHLPLWQLPTMPW